MEMSASEQSGRPCTVVERCNQNSLRFSPMRLPMYIGSEHLRVVNYFASENVLQF